MANNPPLFFYIIFLLIISSSLLVLSTNAANCVNPYCLIDGVSCANNSFPCIAPDYCQPQADLYCGPNFCGTREVCVTLFPPPLLPIVPKLIVVRAQFPAVGVLKLVFTDLIPTAPLLLYKHAICKLAVAVVRVGQIRDAA